LAISPTTNEEFIREVDDELRREQALTIWKRYGRWIIGLVVGGLAIFAGYLWWQNDRAEKRGVEGEQLSAALEDLSAGNIDKAKGEFDKLAASKTGGVAAAAKLTNAAILLQRNDAKGAAAAFGSVAADASVDQTYRDLALVRQTAAEFDMLKPEEVVARLKPLAIPGNPWFGSAGEMVGISYSRMGKKDLAAATFGALVKDETVPQSIRDRVAQLGGTLGVEAAPAKGVKAQ
jgi:hypothetical protein